jgi:hypothetical protein
VADEALPIHAALLATERDRALWDAFTQISERCQTLLRLLMADPPPAYDAVGAALDMPIGSIGPTRARCLDPSAVDRRGGRYHGRRPRLIPVTRSETHSGRRRHDA